MQEPNPALRSTLTSVALSIIDQKALSPTPVGSTMFVNTMLFTMRLVSTMASSFALLMFIGNSSMNHSTVFGCAFVAVIFQVLVCQCLGTTPGFQNDLGVRVLMILIDFTAAFFAMGSGWAIFGIIAMELVDQACAETKCILSIVYGCLVWLAGATGAIAALCHMAVVAKLRRQHHA